MFDIAQHPEIFFPVERRSSTELFTGFAFTEPRSQAIYAPSMQKLINLCSTDYDLVTNQQLVEPAYDMLAGIYGEQYIEVKTRSIDDRKFYVELVVKARLFEVQLGYPVQIKIDIANSYDGSLKHSYALGWERLVCLNGMMAFQTEYTTQRKHYASQNFDPRPVIEMMKDQILTVDTRLERFKKLTERRLLPAEVEELTKTVLAKTKFPKKMVVDVPTVAYGEAERLDVPMSSWLLYNGFNYQLNHGQTKLHPEQKIAIDASVLGILELA